MKRFYDRFAILVTAILLVVVIVLTFNTGSSGSKPEKPDVEFSVSFYDEDKETLLKTVTVKEGESAEAETPTKESTQNFVYIFSNWTFEDGTDATESLASVTKNLTVYAKYTESDRIYIVTFLQPDGRKINTSDVKVGQACNLDFTFDFPYDGKNDYTFVCWVDKDGNDMTEALGCITSDVEVFAKYKVTPKTYGLTFTSPYLRVKHGDGTFFTSEHASQVRMKAGAIITIEYDLPEGYSRMIISVTGATAIDEAAGIYKVYGDVEILAAPV